MFGHLEWFFALVMDNMFQPAGPQPILDPEHQEPDHFLLPQCIKLYINYNQTELEEKKNPTLSQGGLFFRILYPLTKELFYLQLKIFTNL